jgi:hypothetical protein
MGLNPAWRSAIIHIVAVHNWADGLSVEEIHAIEDRLKDELAVMESLVPGGGSYFNEVSISGTTPFDC